MSLRASVKMSISSKVVCTPNEMRVREGTLKALRVGWAQRWPVRTAMPRMSRRVPMSSGCRSSMEGSDRSRAAIQTVRRQE